MSAEPLPLTSKRRLPRPRPGPPSPPPSFPSLILPLPHPSPPSSFPSPQIAGLGYTNGLLASGSWDKTVKVWSLATRSQLRSSLTHSDAVRSICPLRNGHVASGSSDRSIRIRDPTIDGASDKVASGHTGHVRGLAGHPDGRMVSGAWDKTVRMWTEQFGSWMQSAMLTLSSDVCGVCVLANGHVAAGCGNGDVVVWDTVSSSPTRVLKGHTTYVNTVVGLPNGWLASGSDDQSVRVWDPSDGTQILHLTGHQGAVYALSVLPNGRIVSGGVDDNLRVWYIKETTTRLGGVGSSCAGDY